jgi:hypothetical protein
MILVYRPELQNPPMAKEATMGFSFLGKNGLTDFVSVEPGVNRDVKDSDWERIKDKNIVKRLISLGALRVETDDEAEVAIINATDVSDLANRDVTTSMRLIEDSFDITQLRKWEASEKRIRVRNSINKRITAITEGKG